MSRKQLSGNRPSTGIGSYMVEIGRTPLLTADQEIQLARRVQRMRQLNELERPLTPQEKREVRTGKRAMDQFVTANLRLVVSVAKKYHRMTRSLDLMDLVQEGNTGLINGVLKFDPERGYKFSTYAYWWVRQAMSRAIRYKDRAIRLPGNIGEMACSWNKKVQELRLELKREPTVAELAVAFRVTPDDVLLFKERGHHPTSLNVLTGENKDTVLLDCIEDPNNLGGDEAMEQAVFGEMTGSLKAAMALLTDKEQEVLALRWGLGDRPMLGNREIGERFGVTREATRQTVDRAQRRLRLLMAHRREPVLSN
jgi:RNA polymerase sigma factor (sigma-70 family)